MLVQVFEYLDTDLKRFMDKNGKGPKFPLAPKLIKVMLCKFVSLCYIRREGAPLLSLCRLRLTLILIDG